MFMPGVWFLWSKKQKIIIIIKKEKWNTFTLLIIFIVKSLQKEQNSTNLLLWPPICRNKSAITPKWFNSLDTNSTSVTLGPDEKSTNSNGRKAKISAENKIKREIFLVLGNLIHTLEAENISG